MNPDGANHPTVLATDMEESGREQLRTTSSILDVSRRPHLLEPPQTALASRQPHEEPERRDVLGQPPPEERVQGQTHKHGGGHVATRQTLSRVATKRITVDPPRNLPLAEGEVRQENTPGHDA